MLWAKINPKERKNELIKKKNSGALYYKGIKDCRSFTRTFVLGHTHTHTHTNNQISLAQLGIKHPCTKEINDKNR